MAKFEGIITKDTFKPVNMWRSTRKTLALTIKSSPVTALLLVVPYALASHNVGWPSLATFILNFVSIVPLAAVLCFCTEELAEHLGDNIGALLNASFGNAVELIVAVVALKKNEIRVVQTSMLGSVLSNLLFVLGCCFIAGGYNRFEQSFNSTVAQTLSSLMIITLTSLLIPAAFYASASLYLSAESGSPITPSNPGSEILKLLRGSAIILLVIYIIYLFFQMKTHKLLFEVEVTPEEVLAQDDAQESSLEKQQNEVRSVNITEGEAPEQIIKRPTRTISRGAIIQEAAANEEHLSLLGSLITLLIVTVVIAFCADYLVDLIDDIVEKSHMSKSFVGFVLIPIASNVCEHVTSVVVLTKNKMDLAIGVAVGSSIQVAMMVLPLLVLIGWWIDKPMSLLFTTFECSVTFITVFLCNSLISDGKSNYLEGVMLVGTYVIVAVSFFFFPDSAAGN